MSMITGPHSTGTRKFTCGCSEKPLVSPAIQNGGTPTSRKSVKMKTTRFTKATTVERILNAPILIAPIYT